MLVPVGLLARGFTGGGNANEIAALEARSRAESWAFSELSADKQAGRAELIAAATGPEACGIVLLDAPWAAVEVDLVRMTDLAEMALAEMALAGQAPPRKAPDREAEGVVLGDGPHGFHAAPPGRHRIRTNVAGKTSDADFVTLPSEVVFFRWDAGGSCFLQVDAALEAKLGERLLAGDLPLVSYLERVGTPRMQALVTTTGPLALAASERALRAACERILSGNTKAAARDVEAAVAALVGIPVASFAPLTRFVASTAFELASNGKLQEAWLLLQAALVVLPEDPTVFLVLAELQLRAGAKDAARITLERAGSREAGLEAAMKPRLAALRDELAG